MTVIRQTIIDRVETDRAGNIGIRLAIQVIVDGELIDEKYHRTVVDAGVDPMLQMGAVNEHLQQMGKEPVQDDQLDKLRDFVGVASQLFTEAKE